VAAVTAAGRPGSVGLPGAGLRAEVRPDTVALRATAGLLPAGSAADRRGSVDRPVVR